MQKIDRWAFTSRSHTYAMPSVLTHITVEGLCLDAAKEDLYTVCFTDDNDRGYRVMKTAHGQRWVPILDDEDEAEEKETTITVPAEQPAPTKKKIVLKKKT